MILRLAGMMISPVCAVDDVERDLLAEEDVGERLGQLLAQLVHLRLVLFLDLLDLAAAIGRATGVLAARRRCG